MDTDTLQNVLQGLKQVCVAVVGDFAVDRFSYVDPDYKDLSRETGLPVQHVVDVRVEAGGAGTVVKQLKGLGVGRILPTGLLGDDPDAWFLRRTFSRMGISMDYLAGSPDRLTPSYNRIVTLPGERETNRYDVYPRAPLPPADEEALIRLIEKTALECDALVVSDYTETARFGVFSTRVRDAVSELGKRNPALPIIVDSRLQAAGFRHVHFKGNESEFLMLTGGNIELGQPVEVIGRLGSKMAGRDDRLYFITLGRRGIVVCRPDDWFHVSGYTVEGETDIVGAGDAALAALAASLGFGAPPELAALLGVLVSSITVQQMNSTGVATPTQVASRFQEYLASGGEPGSGGRLSNDASD